MKPHKRIRRPLVVLSARSFILITRLLPERCITAIGRMLGALGWLFAKNARHIAESQLTEVFPEAGAVWLAKTVRAVFANMGINLLEAVRLPGLTRVERMRKVEIEGLDLFDNLFRRGKGLVAITGHIGNWEVLGAHVSDLGYPVNVVGRRNPNPGLDRMINSLREGYGAAVLDRDKDARKMIRCLRGGEVLALLVDQDTRVEGAFLPFFGRAAHTPVGHARLAVRTGAPLVVLTIHRNTDGHHKIKVWEEVRPPENTNEQEAIEAVCLRCNQVLEEAIRSDPAQWVWFHKRWKKRPAGEKPPNAMKIASADPRTKGPRQDNDENKNYGPIMGKLKFFVRRAFLSMVLILTLGAGCVSSPEGVGPQGDSELPNQKLEDFVFVETELGKPRWILHANTMSDYKSTDLLLAQGVRVDFFQSQDDSLIKTSTLRADSGKLLGKNGDIRVWGEVEVSTIDGAELFTGWLEWSEGAELISTDDTVLVMTDDGTMRGRGLKSDPELRNVRILNDVIGLVENQQ